MLKTLRKLFDNSARDVKDLQAAVDAINALEPEMEAKSLDELQAVAADLRASITAEGPDAHSTEVFALVREASRRLLGMRQYDVQLIGGLVLHSGRIAEMKTGEGKTLVAVAPMVLNAMTGRGAHLVTVNDYLARRDAVWMGPIYHFLGLSIGIVQGQGQDSDELGGSYIYDPEFHHEDPRYLHLRPCSRREAYLADLTYGTNHEFGFDYLRDNMAFDVAQLSMRELNFALIDEVDSILVDEARTPHIISGPSQVDVSIYKKIDQVVKKLTPEEHYTVDKKAHSAALTEDGMDKIEDLMGLESIADDPMLFHHVSASVKAYGLFEKDINYVVRGGEVVIVDENTGRLMFGRRYSDGIHQALEAKEGVTVQRESQTVAVITFQNLFRMYDKLSGMTGTAKTEEDEFRKIYGLTVVAIPTNRGTQRSDQQDVVYKTHDAKMRGIAREILRLYTKQQPVLVGTRSIEMSEQVSARLTSESLQKLLLADMVLDQVVEKKASKDAKEESKAVLEHSLLDVEMDVAKRVAEIAGLPRDPLSDEARDWFLEKHSLKDDENRAHLEEALRHGVPHNVLNAKYHEKEALIISEAGRKGGVTIATNMAGRGVDILLGGRVVDETVTRDRLQELEDGGTVTEYADTFMSFRRGGIERAAPPLPNDDTERRALAEDVKALGGLYILGTERHESRRIDNQLRGRAGRQGDPGESRFFVSLEDQLWKIFNPKMLENPVLKAWPTHEEVRAKFISGMIQKSQERIENHYFEARKHVLEYDDVLNSQRETVYGLRREILLGKNMSSELRDHVPVVVSEIVNKSWTINEEGESVYDHAALFEELNQLFPLVDFATPSELAAMSPGPELEAFCIDKANEAYDAKAERIGDEIMRQLERRVLLQSVNDRWMEHLQMNDYIREGIQLRAYGQTDPLVAYKRETFDLFQHTQRSIRDDAVKMIFRAEIRQTPAQPAPMMQRVDEAEIAAMEAGSAPAEPTPASPMALELEEEFDVEKFDWKTVKRNDPCPCGSGKKFKACHYNEVAAKNLA
jgi:preprotein translocase subunit SecA